jgi:hypothetical protein
MPEEWRNNEQLKMNAFEDYSAYFEASHAEYLMAGGARVVPIDFRLPEDELVWELEQLNGVYIPGDCKATLDNEIFVNQVGQILNWAEKHNSDLSQHFPVVGMSYGYLAMLASQFRIDDDTVLEALPEAMVHESLQ